MFSLDVQRQTIYIIAYITTHCLASSKSLIRLGIPVTLANETHVAHMEGDTQVERREQ